MTDLAPVPNPALLERLEAVVVALESLGVLDVAVEPRALDAGGFPNVVAAGELIESAWGNAVRQKLYDLAGGNAYSVRANNGIYPTNGNGDALVTFSPVFPSVPSLFVALEATSSADIPLILKLMGLNVTTATVRVYNRDGTKVANHGGISMHWIAYGK